MKTVISRNRRQTFFDTDHRSFIHDLSRLAAKCDLELDEKQKDVLDALTTFNIRGRYDDYKMEFYHRCTEGFTENWLKSIKEFRTWLKENHLKRC